MQIIVHFHFLLRNRFDSFSDFFFARVYLFRFTSYFGGFDLIFFISVSLVFFDHGKYYQKQLTLKIGLKKVLAI